MLANEPKAWLVTMNGSYVPIKVVRDIKVPKEEIEWTNEDLKKIKINNKAINILQCALNPTEFNRTSRFDTTKEILDMLEITCERMNQVKEPKINRLIHMFELFNMKPNENIGDMYTRFNDTVTNLKALRKLDALIGSLMTYEIDIQHDDEVEVVEKKKNVAFKASKQKEESKDDASDDEDISTLVSREVRRFMKKKNFKSRLTKKDEGKSSKKNVKSYECNKMGHNRNECPPLKKGKKKDKIGMKKKAFVATWNDGETSSMKSESSFKNDVANLCFIA
ncbi:hypothetical protein SLEP1_g26271 [Rubroshorea leprosula]|uniref:CCHC-type domain-containing protein n=1 Tax=Rubroshorea leprosula TaxID=152421 RepID=A0AAV5JLN0_9ROSI|nr:hypothetical protein SLEP1_g26271 [Rubroshorea leprosula]